MSVDTHELMDRLQDITDGMNAEIGVYDENGKLFLITEVQDQGEGAPVAIQIREAF